MSDWEQVVPNRPARTISTMVLVGTVGLFLFLLGELIWADLSPQETAVLVLAGIAAVMAWRIGRVGVWVGERGVQSRWPVVSRTFSWNDIEAFEVRPMPRNHPMTFDMRDVQAVWVVTRDGKARRTILWSRPGTWPDGNHGKFILSKKEFAEARKLLEARLGGRTG